MQGLEGRITDQQGNHMCNFVRVFNVVCYCGHAIEPGSAYMVLGSPYNCAMHTQCVPLFPFNGQWPHPSPVSGYTQCLPIPRPSS